MKLSVAIQLPLLAASASALDINCHGSPLCPSDGAPGNLLNLKDIVDGIPQRDRKYQNGEQIACTGSLCVMFQNGASFTANDASRFLGQLLQRGCEKCGSVPTLPGNDVSTGELTVDIVSKPKCQGAC